MIDFVFVATARRNFNDDVEDHLFIQLSLVA